MQDVTEHFARLGLQGLRRHDRRRSEGRGLGDPGAEAAAAARFCDRMNAWAQQRGPAGAGLYLLARGRGGRRRPDRQEHRPRAHRSDPRRSSALATAMPCFFVAGKPDEVRQVRRRGAHQGRRGTRPDRQGPFRLLLDRRFPDVRVERGRQEDRLLAQPVLDAAGRAGGAGDARTRSTSWPTSTTSSATASSCPRAPSATTGPRSCTRPSRSPAIARGRADREVRRHVPRLPVRRAAARRHRAGHRPHRHAAGGRAEHPRGHRCSR